MTAYAFTDDRAAAVCRRYASDVDLGNHSERNRRQRDVAGFWAVLRSLAWQEKLTVAPSPPSGDATEHHVARLPTLEQHG